MIVRVVYFAAAREVACTKNENVTVPSGSRVIDLAREILVQHPSMGGVLQTARFSVNLNLVEKDWQLRQGDEVGVLPPVTGG